MSRLKYSALHVPRFWLALLLFSALTCWHFWPRLPEMHRATPAYMDMCNNTAELLSVMRAVVRHPWTWWRGQYTYPYAYNNALINANFLCGVPYYIVYALTGNACLAYNVLLLLIFIANAMAVYVLVKEWSGSWAAGVFAGALCAFFPHRFHDTVDYHYQVTFMAALALWAWLRFLRYGGVRRLILFFIIVAVKAVSIDYQTVYLALALAVLVPCGFVAYPERLREVWWQFVLCSGILLAVLAPFYFPYYINMTRLPSIGWVAHLAGCTRLDFISWRHVGEQFMKVPHHIVRLWERGTYIPDAPLLPGAVALTVSALGAGWVMVAPWCKGRRAWLDAGVAGLAVLTLLLVIMPVYKYGETPRGLSPLGRLLVDPPLLAFVRNSRAYIHNVMLCASILGGLALGQIIAVAWRARRGLGWCASGVCGVLLIVMTLEHTVRVDMYTGVVPRRLEGVYEWLSRQPKPSPFIEFPFARDVNNFRQAMCGVLADQPTGVAIGRSWPQMAYFLMEIGNQALHADKLALLEASPYRFWVQHGVDAHHARMVEEMSSLRLVTNFGATHVYCNPRIERALPVTLCVTQYWNLSFPNIYTIGLEYTFTSRFTFVPLGERRVRITCVLRDERLQPVARIVINGELPFMLAGPRNQAGVQVTYDPVARRLRGFYRNSGHFNMERWPVSTRRCGDEIYRTRWLDVEVRQAGTGAGAHARLRVVPITPRWPYRFGVPVAIPHQAAGLEPLETVDGRPCQRSRGRYTVVCNGAAPAGANVLALTAKAAVKTAPRPLRVAVALNGTALGVITLAQEWVTYQLPVPAGAWRELNTIVLRYPRTYFPCLLRESYDMERRCALLGGLDAMVTAAEPARPEAAAARAAIVITSNVLRNGSFSAGLEGWQPWRHGVAHTNLLSVRQEGGQTFARIENPLAQLIGLQQTVVLRSGTVYRVRASARAPQNDPRSLWGARVAVYLPPQPEHAVVWMYQDNTFTTREVVFTNQTDGIATVYAHMGFGIIAATGEFTGIAVEQLTHVEAPTNTIIRRDAEGRQHTYTSVLAALRGARDGDEITICPGTYREENAGAEWVMSHHRDVRVRGIGTPVIEVDADAPGYQISMQAPYNERLVFEGIVLHTRAYACSNNVLYGLVVTGSRDVLISNCVLWADIYSTNATFKHVVAVNNATNVRVQDSVIVTRDAGAGNVAWHAASHDAGPLIFARCRLRGLPRARISMGGYELCECEVEETCPRDEAP